MANSCKISPWCLVGVVRGILKFKVITMLCFNLFMKRFHAGLHTGFGARGGGILSFLNLRGGGIIGSNAMGVQQV